MEDALATRSGPRSVGATLRALDSVSIALGVRSETSMGRAEARRDAGMMRRDCAEIAPSCTNVYLCGV